MKKILSLFLVFALFAEGVAASCISAFALDSSDVISVSAENVTVREGIDEGWYG